MRDILGAGKKQTTQLAYASLTVVPLVMSAWWVGHDRSSSRQGTSSMGRPGRAAAELVGRCAPRTCL